MHAAEVSQRSTGQWLNSETGTRWWFDSGSLSLDFGYASFINPADLADWLNQRFARVEQAATDRELQDAEALGDAVARVAIARTREVSAAPEDIDIINLYAAMPDVPPSLTGGRRQAGAGKVRVAQALASVARDAVDLFGERGAGRIRSCAASDCSMVFYDDSRSENRRWCSMQRCGNRAKVRAHRSRALTL
ncbi:MAG TPA: CGNR zinc finger domain-containing protein [Homoserinimonas sp.]|nr:CGNR zinc finger domain-containing protein [Homoserinimonas sp.]